MDEDKIISLLNLNESPRCVEGTIYDNVSYI